MKRETLPLRLVNTRMFSLHGKFPCRTNGAPRDIRTQVVDSVLRVRCRASSSGRRLGEDRHKKVIKDAFARRRSPRRSPRSSAMVVSATAPFDRWIAGDQSAIGRQLPRVGWRRDARPGERGRASRHQGRPGVKPHGHRSARSRDSAPHDVTTWAPPHTPRVEPFRFQCSTWCPALAGLPDVRPKADTTCKW